jgi:hypothetical protein
LRAELSLALPFPDLDWSVEDRQKETAEKLRDYVESLATSSIDWYLRKIVWKRLFARSLHVLAISSGAIAAFVELLNIATVLDSAWVKNLVGASANFSAASRAAEITLLFAGIAGGFKIIDHVAGNSSDWMRFRITASALNTVLANFRFDWMELNRTLPLPSASKATPEKDQQAAETAAETVPPAADSQDGVAPATATRAGSANDSPPAKGKGKARDPNADPVQERVRVARSYSNKIFRLVENETAIWAEELKKRMEPPVTIHTPTKDKRAE